MKLKNLVLGLLMMFILVAPIQAANYTEITLRDTVAISDDAEIIPVSFYIINNRDTAQNAEVTISGDAVDTATYTAVLPEDTTVSDYITINVPVADDYDLESTETLTIVITNETGSEIETINGGTVEVTVNTDSAEMVNELVTDFDVVEDEMNFRDEINFEIELETTEIGSTDRYHRYESVDIKVKICELTGDDLSDADFVNDKCVGDTAKIEDIRFGVSNDEVQKTYDQDDFNRVLTLTQDDADEGDYYLVVEVYGREDVSGSRWGLLDRQIGDEIIELEAAEHDMDILRATPDQQGEQLFFAVEIENNGQNDEDVRVLAEIPALGRSQRSPAGVTIYEDDTAVILVPINVAGVATGEYDVKITIHSDDETVTETFEDIAITGTSGPTPNDRPRLIIGVDQLNKQVSEQGAVYILTFTNNANTARTLGIETAGANWARTSINPATVVIGAQSSEVVSVFVAPSEEATGLQQFTVFIKEDNQIIKSLGMTAQITGAATADEDDANLYEDFINSGLKWIAAILIVVLIVLFVAWSWRREEAQSEVY